ncbi:MAG: DUF438 domain-containing protein [Clostridiales bacterium]|nr:DUF438 domain-containing protein [Clostridiales bacterium]
MLGYAKNDEKRVEELFEFSMGMIKGENGPQLIKKYEDAINNVTPSDMLKLEDMQIQMDVTPEAIKKNVGKVINVFFEKLKSYEWNKPKIGTFLYYLMEENRAIEIKLEGIKKLLLEKGTENKIKKLLIAFEELTKVDAHYVKKENILFPYLEKKMERYRALNVMWSLHDDVRKKLKKIINILKNNDTTEIELNREIGEIFFLIYGLIQKEDLIVYPVASEVISDKEFKEMHMQSFEYEFIFITAPSKPKENINNHYESDDSGLVLKTETGEMNLEQILLVLNKLPLDITFVDENNKVKFFSKPDERFFPRSPAIVGRDVKNCHPPESVHIVEEIVEAFRKGEKDIAKFWLELRGKFIMIQYFALRNNNGEYKGVLEVSQDVTEIRSLKGQQRLLDWRK